MIKSNRGGKRANSGRKKLDEKKVQIIASIYVYPSSIKNISEVKQVGVKAMQNYLSNLWKIIRINRIGFTSFVVSLATPLRRNDQKEWKQLKLPDIHL